MSQVPEVTERSNADSTDTTSHVADTDSNLSAGSEVLSHRSEITSLADSVRAVAVDLNGRPLVDLHGIARLDGSFVIEKLELIETPGSQAALKDVVDGARANFTSVTARFNFTEKTGLLGGKDITTVTGLDTRVNLIEPGERAADLLRSVGLETQEERTLRTLAKTCDSTVLMAEANIETLTGEDMSWLRNRVVWMDQAKFDAYAGNSKDRQVLGLYDRATGRITVPLSVDALRINGTLIHEGLHAWREERGTPALVNPLNEAITQHFTESIDPIAGSVVRTHMIDIDGKEQSVFQVPGLTTEGWSVNGDRLIPGKRSYGNGVDAIRDLERFVGSKAVFDAWSSGDTSNLATAIDDIGGPGTWATTFGSLVEKGSTQQWVEIRKVLAERLGQGR